MVNTVDTSRFVRCLFEKTDTDVTYFLIKHDLKYCKTSNISQGHSSVKPECVIFTENQSGRLGAPKTEFRC